MRPLQYIYTFPADCWEDGLHIGVYNITTGEKVRHTGYLDWQERQA